MEAIKSDYTTLLTEHKSVPMISVCMRPNAVYGRTLQEMHRSVVAERDDLSTSLHHIRGTATPRPEWSRCEGYVENWAETSQGHSSDQLVDVLLAKISGKTLEEVTAHSAFQGQVGEDVSGCVLLCTVMFRVWGRMFHATFAGRGRSPTIGSLRAESMLSLVAFGHTSSPLT